MKKLDIIAGILVLLGALNWGLIGFFERDPIGVLGRYARVVDCLVGLSAVYFIVQWKRCKGMCKGK